MMLFEKSMKDLAKCLAPLKLSKFELIFFPLNDSTELEKDLSGSHWSLAVYERSSRQLVYLDSMSLHSNNAELLCKRLS